MYNPLKWSAYFLQALYTAGSQHLFISPGSRSTPLVLAAALHPGFSKTVILDERSAAFAALGASRKSGRPSVLICTSGTAAANYYPAIIEAKESGVPLVVLTADRPPGSRQIGSSQTIDQIKLYGNQAVFFHEAGEPANQLQDHRRIIYLAGQAHKLSVRLGGASHINFPFRKPLEPGEDQAAEVLTYYESAKSKTASFQTKPSSRTIRLSPDLISALSASEKPLVIGGVSTREHDLSDTGMTLSRLLSAPIIAEPGSWYPDHSNRVYRFEQILKNLPDHQIPDLIVRTGDQPFTRSVIDFLSGMHNIPIFHFTAREADQDHAMNVTRQIVMEKSDKLLLPEFHKRPDKWLRSWLVLNQHAQNILIQTLNETDTLTDGHVVQSFARETRGFPQMISNSFTPRDLALFGDYFGLNDLNRGAAGIDGILSTAAGMASVSDEKVYCLAGDLAFLHDSNALFTIKNLKTPLITVVINNSGGAIFKMLPVYRKLNAFITDDMFKTYFETPHQISVQKLAEAAGLPYYKATTPAELQAIPLRDLRESAIIECVTDPDLSMSVRQKLWGV